MSRYMYMRNVLEINMPRSMYMWNVLQINMPRSIYMWNVLQPYTSRSMYMMNTVGDKHVPFVCYLIPSLVSPFHPYHIKVSNFSIAVVRNVISNRESFEIIPLIG